MHGASTPTGNEGPGILRIHDRLSTTDGTAAALWLASRASVFVAATYSTWVLAGRADQFYGSDPELIPTAGPVASWNQWDLAWYASIARDGYGAIGFENSYAFMPGFPSLLWVFGKLNIHPTLAGLLISAAAGLVAAVALSRLTSRVGGRGEYGVLAWVLAPSAVYLAAPYTEALFCALAFPAWLLARRGSWLGAAALASGACLVRVNGLFLAVALVVLFLTQRPRRWHAAPWLALPFLTLLAVFTWFRSLTGSWTTWFEAQEAGWQRNFQTPWDAFNSTVNYASNIGVTATFSIQYKLEIVFALLVLALAIAMLIKGWWAEAVYVLLTLASLATSTVFYSIPRATLVLFPVWMLMGLWLSRSKWVLASYVALCAPLMLVGVVAFVNGRWVA